MQSATLLHFIRMLQQRVACSNHGRIVGLGIPMHVTRSEASLPNNPARKLFPHAAMSRPLARSEHSEVLSCSSLHLN
jgi:hypothetical protein